jgi:hypothetical protein
MPEIDDPAGPLPGITMIQVDVSGLDRFAGSVESEVEANYRPQAANLMRIYEVGSHFGLGHTSPDVLASRERHTECLQAAADQLAGYANAAKILVDAAREIAARYRDSDAFAAANAQEVEQALWAGVHAANRAQLEAGAAVPTAADGATVSSADGHPLRRAE